MKPVARLIFALSLALAARADGYVQNLDAKPIVLPCGLKFGEMYKGAVKSARSNYVNGREYKRYEAVITNSWCSFDEFTIMLTGKKRIEGVMGVRRGGLDFDEAVSNLIVQKEAFVQEYGIRFGGDAEPKTFGEGPDAVKSLSFIGIGADEEMVLLSVSESKWLGEKAPKVGIEITVTSRMAQRLEDKSLNMEASEMRAAIKKVFGVDLEEPQSKPLWGFEWENLPTPIEGLTERRCATGHMPGGKLEFVSFRRVFDGDVSRAELVGAARRVVVALENAYGRKLPDSREKFPKKKNCRIPAAYDTVGCYGEMNRHYVAHGVVGALIVSVEYAEPRYALRNGKYELVFKGGVQFSASIDGVVR